ncbi:MAG: SRPBCC family protein [Candidatus Sericytochromatia bacterium]
MAAIIHLSTHLGCDAAQAFRLFTDGTALQWWLAPVAEVDGVVGGKFELYWDPSDRSDNHTRGCRITALSPGELVAFDWRGPSQFREAMNDVDPLTHVVVSFTPVEGGTHVHLVHAGWRSTPQAEEARAWFERAWTMAFEQLKGVAQGPSTTG